VDVCLAESMTPRIKQRVMYRVTTLASIMVVAAISVNCSNSREGQISGNALAPSVLDAASNNVAIDTAGGHGGKKPGGATGSLTLVMDVDLNGNGLPTGMIR